MANDLLDISGLLKGLDKLVDAYLDGAIEGLEEGARQATTAMRGTRAHRDVTGATRASYVAFAVGRGRTGAAAAAESFSRVEALNPGRAGRSRVTLDQPLGVIFMSGTDYQSDLEKLQAGARAVIGPTVARFSPVCVREACKAAKRKLNS